ncbi:MAG: hypothetical protein K6A41_01930 [Bacteroidales bacterium]|nr:hypothetical protein [Bacteroidales bacterium]
MKKFLIRLSIFVLILFVLALGADIIITRQFKKLESSPFANWNDIYSGNIQSDVLIMGSSRAYVQFNPYILDSILNVNSYNLGMNGRAVESQVVKYHVYRHENKNKPKLILYELYQGSLDTSNGYDRIQFVPYLQDCYLWKEIKPVDHFTWADAFIPCWRYRKYKPDIFAVFKGSSFYQREDQKVYKGFIDYDKQWDGKAFAKIDTIHYGQQPLAIAEMKQFLSECHDEGIPVVFVIAPYYIGATQKIENISGMYKLFHEIADPYNVPILDYTYDTLSYDTAYFYNASHLNRTGTTLFTAKLAHDLDSLNLVPR